MASDLVHRELPPLAWNLISRINPRKLESALTDIAYLAILNPLMLGSSVAEQVAVNHLVAGSNPARAAIFMFAI